MAGSVPAAAGDFGFALQNAKVGEGGTFNAASYTWYRADPVSARIDLIQGDQNLPPEVRPTITPIGAFKDGLFGAGQADLIPRMEHGLGILLFGLMGAVSTVTGVNADGDSVAGVNTHIFRFASTPYNIPWMAFRRLLPSSGGTADHGDTIFDAKINNMRFTVGNRGKAALRLTMVGRDVDQEENPSWTWDQDYEDPTTTPDTGGGFIKVAGIEYPMTGAVVEFDNGVSNPNQERIVGSYRPDDFIPLFRICTIRFVYKWSDNTLYKLLRNGGSGLTWSSLPYGFATGSDYAFELSMPSPAFITGTERFDLRVRGNRGTMGIDGPIEIAGGQLLQQAFTITVQQPLDGSDYLNWVLVNDHASYNFSYTV